MISCSHGEMDQQSRVVELAVEINHASSQLFGLQGRQPFERLLFREELRRSKTIFASEQIVELQANPVKRRLPP